MIPLRALVILFFLILFLSPASRAQDLLEVARTQMAAGLTRDARVLTGNYLDHGGPDKDRALYYQAILTASADSALACLLDLAGRADRSAQSLAALERLGDLAYAGGQYREAADRWKSAADRAADPETSLRCLVKLSRATLRLGRATEATALLRQSQALGEASPHGLLRYYLGLSKEQAGDTNGAAEDFLALYVDRASPYQLAALSHLASIYGQGGSKSAVQWRSRLDETARGTVFDPSRTATVSPSRTAAPAAAGDWSIQLGAFSSRKSAVALAEKVRKRTGLVPQLLKPGSDRLFRVRLTGLASKTETDRAAALLKKNRIKYRVLEPEGPGK